MSLVVEMSGCFIVTACASQLKSNIMLLLREPVQSLDWVPGKKKMDWVIELSSLITGVFDRDSSRHMESSTSREISSVLDSDNHPLIR